jgi:hypothetical protein
MINGPFSGGLSDVAVPDSANSSILSIAVVVVNVVPTGLLPTL